MIENLIKLWQDRQIEYENLAEKYKSSEQKFTYKAVATRDCWKELQKMNKSSDELKVQKLVNQFCKEELKEKDVPYSSDAEIYSGMKYFLRWIKQEDKS